MNNWLHDSNPGSNNNHAGFGPATDGAMSFLQPPTTINPAQFQNQAFLNGAGRTSSPAFYNPVYQTNPVIPSKRQREDSLGASPRQAPGGLPGSRSQTPGQGAYPGYTPQTNGGAPPFANLQHLQSGSNANATPSPTIQQNNFGQSSGPQRVSTASPSPFSPHHGGPQMSPAPSDHASRVGTPHDNPANFMPGTPFGAAFNPAQFGGGMNTPSGQMQMAQQMMAQQQQAAAQGMNATQRSYQMQVQAQARQMQQAAQARAMNGASMPNATQMTPMQQAGMPPKPNSPEDFLRTLTTFMASRNRTVDVNPVICTRPVQLMRLYASVVKAGGSQKITKLNQWGFIAQQLQLPPQLQAQAAQELHQYWMVNLAPYESVWIATQQKQQQQVRMAQGGMQGQMQNQMSPSRNNMNGQDPGHQRSQSDLLALKMNGQLMNNLQQATPNGYMQAQMKDQQNMAAISKHRASLSRQFENQQQPNGLPPQMTMSPQKRPLSRNEKLTGAEPELTMPVKKPIEDPFIPAAMPPSRFHGPVIVDEAFNIGQSILEVKPVHPTLRDLGLIDVHTLTMAIKSGMHAETRVALDTLVTLSMDAGIQFSLSACDDLMETLVDCAQTELDFLADNAAEVSDEMLLSPYEELLRGCKIDAESLQTIPVFGSLEYDLDRAADRIICITTLIRNFSFYEANFAVLGMPEVITFLTSVVRYLGTKELLLRNNRNAMDFMKDVVIYLSNLSHSIQLPGREEALCLLHFLLSFAPMPSPVSSSTGKVSFSMYSPSIHKYVPAAVDSLAKLLARDEPNRTFYKAIFTSDIHSSPPYELLTRAFGLAICPLPSTAIPIKATVEARKPFFLQGMLAAEILSNLCPGSDHELARLWLESEDGFAMSLLRLVCLLSSDRSTQTGQRHPQQHGRNAPEHDANAYGAITNRAIAVLKTLVQKARTTDDKGAVILPAGVLLKREVLLGALMQKEIDGPTLRQLCIYAGLED